jgi:hypothetical protein
VPHNQDSSLTASESSEGHASGVVGSWLTALGDRVLTGAELALAETRLAITSFMLMIFLAVLAAGALLFAWALLVFAAGQWAVSMGFSPVGAALVLFVIHLLLAWLLWRAANALGQTMGFPETRRLLSSAADSHEEQAQHDG